MFAPGISSCTGDVNSNDTYASYCVCLNSRRVCLTSRGLIINTYNSEHSVCMYVHTLYICMYSVCMYVCMSVCVFIYTLLFVSKVNMIRNLVSF